MPFKSRAQVGFMFKNHPEIAHRWAHEYGVPKGLPGHVGMRDVIAGNIRRRKKKRKS